MAFFKPGAKKGRGAWPEREVRRAELLMAEYFARKKAIGKAKGTK